MQAILNQALQVEDNKTEVTITDIFGDRDSMVFNMSLSSFVKAYTDWKNGAFIQDAFNVLTNVEREFILSGLTPAKFNILFPEGEE